MAKIFASIKSPCVENWDAMQGDEYVRFCGKCNLNVYNFSKMTDGEVINLLEQRPQRRICARIIQRYDGSIITDNCPYQLRRHREKLRILGFLIWLLHPNATFGQGLNGVPLNIDVASFSDYGYDTARDIVRVTTFMTWAFGSVLGWVRIVDGKKIQLLMNQTGVCRTETSSLLRRRIFDAIVISIVGPIIVWIVGIFAINNIGSLGGAP